VEAIDAILETHAAQQGLKGTMKEITAKKEDLLGTLRANQKAHYEMFCEAVKGYRRKAIERLTEEIERIEKGSQVRIVISMPVPQDHTNDYDRVIKMLTWLPFSILSISSVSRSIALRL